RAKLLIFPQLIGSVARFPILFIFIYFLQSPIQGTILAFSIFFVPFAIFYCLNLRWFLKNSKVDLGGFITTLRNIVTTGFSSWIPHMISILGSQLSIISIF